MKPGKEKYLFVIDNLSTGGAQRQMINLATGLKKRDYQIEVFCYAKGDMLAQPLYEMEIPVHWHIKRGRFSLDVISALRALIDKGQYSLALSFLTTPNFYTILSGKLFRLHRLPIVVSERFCDLPKGVSLLEGFSRQFYYLSNHVIVNSHHQRLNLEDKYPKLKGDVSTIYNGYDLQFFIPASTEPVNNPIKLLTIASISRYKNGNCLMEALNILRLDMDYFRAGLSIYMAKNLLRFVKAFAEKMPTCHLLAQLI